MVDNRVIWVSGNNGTVGRSVDGGDSWTFTKVKDFEKTDFRDIEAFDADNAVIMGIAEPAYILRTNDGGKSWDIVYENKMEGMFLDAMDFHTNGLGVVIGDPINNHLFMARTNDFGKTWKEISLQERPVMDSGEACFASSGTNIRLLNSGKPVIITGGLSAHFFSKDRQILLPLIQGKESTGANSIAFKNNKTLITVGGDFMQKEDTKSNCAITMDGGKSWESAVKPPAGYRSCVEYLKENSWITCGLNGVDISHDDGKNWNPISTQSFHSVRKAKNGDAVFFSGNNGKIGKLVAN